MFEWVLNTPVQQNPDRIPFRIICNRLLTNITKNRYPDNCPPEENCSPVRVVVWVKVRLSFRVEGNQAITFVGNYPRLVVGFGLGLVLGLGDNFSRRQLS